MAKNDNNAPFTVGFLLGAAVGALIGLMIAPKSGSQTRSELADRSHTLRSKADEMAANMRDRVGPTVETARETARGRITPAVEGVREGVRERVTPAVESVRERVGPAAESVRERVAPVVEQVSSRVRRGQNGQSDDDALDEHA